MDYIMTKVWLHIELLTIQIPKQQHLLLAFLSFRPRGHLTTWRSSHLSEHVGNSLNSTGIHSMIVHSHSCIIKLPHSNLGLWWRGYEKVEMCISYKSHGGYGGKMRNLLKRCCDLSRVQLHYSFRWQRYSCWCHTPWASPHEVVIFWDTRDIGIAFGEVDLEIWIYAKPNHRLMHKANE